jgi:hypothetical protein
MVGKHETLPRHQRSGVVIKRGFVYCMQGIPSHFEAHSMTDMRTHNVTNIVVTCQLLAKADKRTTYTLLGIGNHFNPEDGGSMALRNLENNLKFKRCYRPEQQHRHLHRRENLRSKKVLNHYIPPEPVQSTPRSYNMFLQDKSLYYSDPVFHFPNRLFLSDFQINNLHYN